jgi:hypothetical protein
VKNTGYPLSSCFSMEDTAVPSKKSVFVR